MILIYLLWIASVLKSLVNCSIVQDTYIIEYANGFEKDHSHILGALQPLKEFVQVRQTFTSDVFHGVSIQLKQSTTIVSQNDASAESLEAFHETRHSIWSKLLSDPSVKRIYPVHNVPRPQWDTSVGTDMTPLPFGSMSQTSLVHKLNITGSGVLIGIIDTGVDYTHPALGGGFGQDYKIRLGQNLVDPAEDDRDTGGHRGKDDPFDPCSGDDAGHGTHVAGIIAAVNASINFFGVAPDATLGMWRVFGCSGSAGEDIVIKALEMAYDAGCHVINLSLGVQTAWPENAISVVADRLSSRGVSIVSVAGNQGSSGVYMQNSPGSGKLVVSVAAMDNDVVRTKTLTVNVIPGQIFGYQLGSATVAFPSYGTVAIMLDKHQQAITGCKSEPPSKQVASGKILLVRRGGCTFDEKLQMAQEAGAIATIIYDPTLTNGAALTAQTSLAFPGATITFSLAEKLIGLYVGNRERNITLYFSSTWHTLRTNFGEQMASLSSAGPTYELDLKPNIAGIGYQVFSTLPCRINGGWGIKSGTSMAAPHVAGTIALLIQWHRQRFRYHAAPNITFIHEMLQNHARPAMVQERPDHPILQGAGLTQPLDVMQSNIHVSPSQLSFNDTANIKSRQTLKITNLGSRPIACRVRHIAAKSILSYANTTSFVPTEPIRRGNLSVQLVITPDLVILEQGQSTEITVTVMLPDPNLVDYHYQMYGGYILFIGGNRVSTATVPYFGILGRVKLLPLFDHGFPFLASVHNATHVYAPTDVFLFNLTENGPPPMIVTRLVTASARIHMEVMQHHKVVGELEKSPFLYWERNRLDPFNFQQTTPWNGKILLPQATHATLVEQGIYRIRVRALKLLGNPHADTDWESWISGPIKVL